MIEFRRGDTFLFKVQITNADSKPIILEEIDTLFITCKEQPFDDYPILFDKKLEDVTIDEEGYCHIVFDPENTESLNYSTYYFDIEITLKSGFRKTELYTFKLTEKVTTHGGENSGN